jgi:hypothetical protein
MRHPFGNSSILKEKSSMNQSEFPTIIPWRFMEHMENPCNMEIPNDLGLHFRTIKKPPHLSGLELSPLRRL